MDELTFYNSVNPHMTFEEIFSSILSFINQDTNSTYKLIIGSDSHIHMQRQETVYISGIVLRRFGSEGIGRGSWACKSKHAIKRPMRNLREKIGLETTYTKMIFDMFDDDRLLEIYELTDNFSIAIHLDIGRNGPTKDLIDEMIEPFEGLENVEVKIKPDSYVASGFANRDTK